MTPDGLRAGVAVIECTWGYGPCGHAATESHVWWPNFTAQEQAVHRFVCAQHARYSRCADVLNGWPHMHHRLLQPTLATDEEVLMVEMMCHGVASLAVPR